ncbi:MAG: alpha/beta hydrolase family protein [Phycisphaeraceae bacterium]
MASSRFVEPINLGPEADGSKRGHDVGLTLAHDTAMVHADDGAAPPRQPADVAAHLAALHGPAHRTYVCPVDEPARLEAWRETARPALRQLVGLERIAADVGSHAPTVELGEPERIAGEPITRRLGYIQVEPTVRLPFHLVEPNTPGPHPLAIMPHGHGKFGMYAGVVEDEAARRQMLEEDRDVALQAARRGMVAIAPATRGIDGFVIRNVEKTRPLNDCHLHMFNCLLAGRTAIGERVWDAQCIIDWALAELNIDSERILVTGNSGGGVATLFIAACDARVTVAVPSCSYTVWVTEGGTFPLCPCNAVPGITRFGEGWDVAGLIAPRWLMCVHGSTDPTRPPEEAAPAIAPLQRIYEAAGVPERFAHGIGEGGHRFYSDLMWPFIEKALAAVDTA